MPATIQTVTDVLLLLERGDDGPITCFVLISRACALAGQGADTELVANALHISLTEYGWLADDGDVLAMGS